MNVEQIQYIRLEKIIPNPENRRVGGFNQAKLEQLAESIRAVGVQQPAVVRRIEHNGEYELVAGERRLRAAKLADLETLPCVVRDIDDITVLKIQTIENLQREDVHPLDEAEGYARLIEKARYDVEVISQEIGKSISYVYQRLKLRDLIPKARDLLINGDIAAGHAILIARLQPAQQKEVVEHINQVLKWERIISVRELGSWIQDQILMELAKAPFKKDDDALLPDAGPCTTCPKRTGYQPVLFADVCKKDYCTDPHCFNAKLDALLERRRRELEGQDYIQVQHTYASNRPEGVIPYYEWNECKKKDEGAQQCLIVSGPDRGRITWGKVSTYSSSFTLSPEEKKKMQEQKREEKIQKETRKSLYQEIILHISKRIDETEAAPLEIMKIVAKKFYGSIWDNYRKLLCSLEGWKKPEQKDKRYWGWGEVGYERIEEMDETELILFLAKCALIDEIEYSRYQIREDDKDLIHNLVSLFSIDADAIEKEIRERRSRKNKS
jgi:ParB/RepB/Spo0J family partition protein